MKMRECALGQSGVFLVIICGVLKVRMEMFPDLGIERDSIGDASLLIGS